MAGVAKSGAYVVEMMDGESWQTPPHRSLAGGGGAAAWGETRLGDDDDDDDDAGILATGAVSASDPFRAVSLYPAGPGAGRTNFGVLRTMVRALLRPCS